MPKNGCTADPYSHHLVVGAVDRQGGFGEHHCIETGQDRNQFHIKPRYPVSSFKLRETSADYMEGSVHHYVSHGRVDVRNLIKNNKRGLISAHFARGFRYAHPFGFFGN